MKGPALLARTMSVASTRGKGERGWQYHSRSDHHSKVACWAVLFDLMLECDVVRDAAQRGRLSASADSLHDSNVAFARWKPLQLPFAHQDAKDAVREVVFRATPVFASKTQQAGCI